MLVFACLILCSTHHAALWHVRSSWCSTRSPELKKDLQMYFPSIIVFKNWWYFLANWVVIFLLFFPIKCSLFSNGLTQSVFNRWICCRFLGQPSEPSQLKFVFRVTFLLTVVCMIYICDHHHLVYEHTYVTNWVLKVWFITWNLLLLWGSLLSGLQQCLYFAQNLLLLICNYHISYLYPSIKILV